MDCREAQESILESLTEPLAAAEHLAMQNHLATCEACTGFAEMQNRLDARLTAAVPQARLSPGFRAALKARVRRDPLTAWPDFLPDMAHLIGCGVATVVWLFVLPVRPETVVLAGAAFTAVTYVLQAALRTSLEGSE